MSEQTVERRPVRSRIGWVDELENPCRVSGWIAGGPLDAAVEIIVSVNGAEVGRVQADKHHESKRATDGKIRGFLLELEPSSGLKHGDVVRVRSAEGDFPLALGWQQFGLPCSPIWTAGVTNCLIVGHSHAACLTSAYSEAKDLLLDASFIQLHQYSVPDAPGKLADKVIDRISGWLADFDGKATEPVLVISPWGNEHNALGLTNHPRRFDFVHPAQPELPLDEQAQLLPYGAFHDMMAKRCAHAFEIAERLSEFPVSKRYWIEAPPPVASEEYIRTYPQGYKDIVGRSGVAPAALRYKVWLLRATVIREWCQAHGWGYIPVPARAKDEQGFLTQQGWPYWDAVHGNAWFGEVMLREIQAVAGKEGV